MVTIMIDKAVTLATITMVVIFSTCGVHGYGNGAIPDSACQSMYPEHHGAQAKTSPSPYSVTVSKTSYSPGDTVTVTIAGREFGGFMVQARRADPSLNTLEALGSFTPVPNTHQLCNGGALSHTDDFKRESISFEWIAPTAAEGHIQFRATVVEVEADFWVDVKSPIVSDPTAPDISENSPSQDCGGAGGCFMHPTGCQGGACVASITWTPEGSATTPAYVDITLTGDTDGYVAVGLSTDQSMGADSVMECVNDGVTVTALMSYNEGHTNQENKFTEGISDVTGSVVNGTITCSFRRMTSVAGNSKIFPLDTAYYLLVALGDYSEGRKQRHVTRLSSAEQFRLTEVSAGAGGGGGTSDCGGAAGCFMDPSGCQGDACVASITWTPEGFTSGRKRRQTATTPAYVDITLTGHTDGYVAVGLSTDQSMGDDSVMECVNDGVTVTALMSYNEGRNNQENKFTDGISNVTGSVVNGRITCSFRRMTSVAGNSKIFRLDTDYYLLVALGAISGENKQLHTTRLSSASKYRLTEASTGGGGAATGSGYGLVQAHAILMVAAWLLTGCLGMMMARYYKQGWPDKTMCGTKVWFNVHRVLMILTLFLTLAGFIVIFIHVKGYSGHLEGFLAAHPPLGIVVTALVIINPIMAAFRPHPGTSKRTMFNWAHWAVANLALILAVICIGFGFNIPTVAAFAPGYLFWIFIGMIVFQALVWIVLDIHRRVSNSRTKKEYDIQLKDRQDMGEQVPPTPTITGSTFPYVMLGIFILGTLGFFLAIAVLLCI